MLEQINPRDILESTRITDQITKIIAAIEKIEGGRDVLGATIETMDRFTRYLMRAEEDKQLIGKISERIHGFFEETRRM